MEGSCCGVRAGPREAQADRQQRVASQPLGCGRRRVDGPREVSGSVAMKPLASFEGQQTQFSWPIERHTLVDFDGPAAVLAVQNASTIYVGVVVDEAEQLRRWLVGTLDAPQAIYLLGGRPLLRDAIVRREGILVDQT